MSKGLLLQGHSGVEKTSTASAQVDSKLQGMNKEKLSSLIADEIVAEAKLEEEALMAQWSALVSDVTARARGAGTGLVEEDASLLQGAIATALASNLEPETEITFKEFLDRTCQTSLATKVQQATALEWVSLQHACLTNSYLRSKLASNACSGCDKEVFHDIGLGCLVLKIVGKPGALKSKLYYRKPETGSPPARLTLYFGGKASAVVWDSVMSGGGGAKNRILLKSGTQKEIEDNDQKWGLTLTPLPGMTTLQSSIWQPAWNVPA